MKLLKINFIPLVLLTLILSYLGAQRIHESGHWLFLQIFQREPNIGFLGLIQIWNSQPSSTAAWSLFTDPNSGSQGWFWLSSLPQSNFEWIGFLMMGQVFQIFIIIVGLFIINRTKNILIKEIAFVVVIINSFTQLIYQSIKFINVSGGDEYFASYFWGISPRLITGPLAIFYISVFVISILWISGWKEGVKYLIAAILAQAVGPLLGFFDSIIHQQAILNNPFIDPVFGFSLPVLILDVVILFAFWILLNNMRSRLLDDQNGK